MYRYTRFFFAYITVGHSFTTMAVCVESWKNGLFQKLIFLTKKKVNTDIVSLSSRSGFAINLKLFHFFFVHNNVINTGFE